MKPLDKLRFHKFFLPGLQATVDGRVSGDDLLEPRDPDEMEPILAVSRDAVLFDCRQRNDDFLDDTGNASLEEIRELGLRVRLPFERCYFEYSGHRTPEHWGILAVDDSDEIRFWFVNYTASEDASTSDDSDDEIGANVACCLLSEPLRLGVVPDEDDLESGYFDYTSGAPLLAGTLALLNEHLLATEVRPDPAPKLNAARARRGRLPLTAETRVLTINTAAVRRTVSGIRLLKHESPRLHWRRGHWRVLRRGSEFASKAWMRRCLVGDPTRGIIHKDYRMVWRQPMLGAQTLMTR